jgi:ribosome biogenesis protein MAK21
MKCTIVREVRQLIYRPHLAVRAVHNGIVFLSQVNLVNGDHDVAAQLVECYMSLFEKAVSQEELGSRLLSSLLSGLDRAFPYLGKYICTYIYISICMYYLPARAI